MVIYMKTTGLRSVVLYILLFCFIGGVGYMFFNTWINGAQWAAQPYNGHIYAEDATAQAGEIKDRNNILLAVSDNGVRYYSENTSIRTSLLHTVGDSSGYIGTSVQSNYRSKLMGYNMLTGLNYLPFNGFGMNNVRLTVDAELCAAAYEALNGLKGAVVIYNYKTGEILCKVSTPSYDPMNVPSDLSENTEYEGVFVDNTISSAYAPGSIFKVVTAVAAMETMGDWQDRTYYCEGEYYFGDEKVTCLDYHGEQNMSQAMGNSCNIYFSRLAVDLGTKTLQSAAEELGFNKNFSFNEFTTAKSVINLTSATEGDLGWAGVGQYTVTANPMHMALIMGAVANGGSFTEPYVVQTGLFDGVNRSTTNLMSSSIATNLKNLLRDDVEYYYGDYLFYDMNVCAKTGTAEVGEDKNPTSWIIGFSDNESTPYAFSIAVEEGGSGIGTAGNIASTLLTMAKDRGL